MIEGRLIVCIASSWDYDPTSKHQIMQILSRGNDILWINYHGSRRPVINRIDIKDSLTALGRISRGLQRVSPSITQLTPFVLPGATHPWLSKLHRRALIAQLRRAIRTVQNGRRKPIQIWTFAPDVPYLAGAFDEECFLYYCVDEYTRFKGFDSERIALAEDELMERADVVVTTSGPLWETKRAKRSDAVLIRHGVDYDHFATAWRSPPPCPGDLVKVNPPIFGFFGVLHHWIDRLLLAEVARLRPKYSFALIGECKADVTELEKLDNVHLLGRRPYEQLPAYCATFDAALLPFTQSAMTRSVNPVKMHEYLAAGLPVVSTPLPEAQRFNEAIRIAQTAGDFAEACDAVLAETGPEKRRAISRLVEDQSWVSKVEQLSTIIENGAPRNEPASPVGQSSRPSCAGVL